MSKAMLWSLLGHLVCVVQWNAFILVDFAYLGKGKIRHPVLWAELLGIAQLVLSVVIGMPFFNATSVLINTVYLLVISMFFGGTLTEKLTACLINGTMCLLTENTVNYTFSWFTGVLTGAAWRYPACLVILCAANLVSGALVASFLRGWNKRRRLDPLQALTMSFFPGVAVALNIVLMVSGTHQPATLLTMLLTLGMTVAVLVHIIIMQMFNEQVVQRKNSRARAQMEKERAEALLNSYTAQRRLTHEFTNHMAALDALLTQGDLKGAQNYIAGVTKAVAAGTTVMDTHNPLLDAILTMKYEDAAKQRASIFFDLCDLRELPFDGTDMVILLSNLLDNAIRAAAEALPPEVHVRIRKNQDELLISVRNRVQQDMDIEDGTLPASTKQESGHGMGLVNVQEVLEKYGGEYTVSCRDRWFRFTCSLPLDSTVNS